MRDVTCLECCSRVPDKYKDGHVNWHVNLHLAILTASGLFSPEHILAATEEQRLKMESRFSVL
jgi:hypothetical protein